MPEYQQQLSNERTAFVIFGVTGDLTSRKLIPALYELASDNRLPQDFIVIGFARRDWSNEKFVQTIHDSINTYLGSKPKNPESVNKITNSVHYLQSAFDDIDGYQRLNSLLHELGVVNILYYLATPPDSYINIIQNIGESGAGQTEIKGWSRIVIEKPYGRDLNSAKLLEDEVHKVFNEDQIYRIDHYLGKETVQNILVFRFANGIFEPLWDRRYVDHVQITVAETVGVGSRGMYYDTVGVIRDMFQNHMLQLLTLTAMEAPAGFTANAVRDEKVKVLRSIRPMSESEVLANTYRAQYVSGTVEGQRVTGYKDENNVPSDSVTETLMASRLYVDNWRWAGIPFYLRSGKRLPCRATDIVIHFKQAPLSLFNWKNVAGEAPNTLVLNVQPNEGIRLSFGAKVPGPVNSISPVNMEFNYQNTFGISVPEAYERLLLDSMIGDATLFTRSDEVLAQWEFTDKILKAWSNHPIKHLPVYESSTWGPPGSDEFIGRDNRIWHNPDSPRIS